MKKLPSYFYFFIICIIMPKSSLNRKSVKLNNIECTSEDKDFAVFKVCNMKAVNRDITEVNIHVELKQTPVSNVTVHGILRKRGKINKPPIFHFTVDGCAFMRNKRRNPFALMVYEAFALQKYSNVNHTCPFNHDVIVKNWRLSGKSLRVLDYTPLPNGEYTLFTSWLAFNRGRTNVTISFKLHDTSL